jgi:peptide/nickel transport system substrate-binding protein
MLHRAARVEAAPAARHLLNIAASLPRTALAFLFALAITAPASAAEDSLTVGVVGAVASLHPDAHTVSENFLRAFGHRPLSAPDIRWVPVCFLCTTLPTIENGLAKRVTLPDGKTGLDVTFALWPDATWDDGVAVTTKDVLFTWQVGRTPDIGYSNQEAFQHITSVTALDDKRFTLHYDRVQYQFNLPIGFEILPEHVEAPIFDALPDKRSYLAHSAYTVAPTTPGLWCGPYRLVRYERDKEAVFERNPSWAGKPPGFSRIIARLYPTVAEATAALRDEGRAAAGGRGALCRRAQPGAESWPSDRCPAGAKRQLHPYRPEPFCWPAGR